MNLFSFHRTFVRRKRKLGVLYNVSKAVPYSCDREPGMTLFLIPKLSVAPDNISVQLHTVPTDNEVLKYSTRSFIPTFCTNATRVYR